MEAVIIENHINKKEMNEVKIISITITIRLFFIFSNFEHLPLKRRLTTEGQNYRHDTTIQKLMDVLLCVHSSVHLFRQNLLHWFHWLRWWLLWWWLFCLFYSFHYRLNVFEPKKVKKQKSKKAKICCNCVVV